MKKRILFLALCPLFLAACGTDTAIEPRASEEQPGSLTSLTEGTVTDEPGGQLTVPDEPVITCAASVITTCRIVDGAEEGSLMLANMEGNSLYRLWVDEEDLVLLDGEEADASALEDGMVVEISHSGMILYSSPAQFAEVYSISAWSLGSARNPGGAYYDLCGLYLKVLDDLWNADSALNDGVEVVGIDLSNAPGGLTESEKHAVVWRFGESHGVEVVTGTFDGLVEKGYITAETGDGGTFLRWENGLLLSITAGSWEEDEIYSLPVLKFEASKWRSSLGAYGFGDCSVVWPEMGTWSDYQIGSQWIS